MTILLVLAGIAVLSGVFYYSYESALPSPTTAASSTPAGTSTSPAPSTSTPTYPVTPHPSSTTPTPTSGTYLTPTSGAVGATVTIHGSGFAPTGNTITFDGLVGNSMKGVSSNDSKTLTFTVPANLGPNCKPNEACPQFLMLVMSGDSYTVAVTSGAAAQTIGTFTVTGGGGTGLTPQ